MKRAYFSIVVLWLAAALFLVSFSREAFAEDKKVEAEAKELQRKAIEEDNLATNYDAAAKKLQSAVKKCAGGKCGPAVRGGLHRDLGAMLLLAGKKEEGIAAFIEALSIDATLALDASYKTATLEKEWENAKKKAGIESSGPGPVPSPTKKPTKPAPTGSGPAGDFTHSALAHHLVRAPFPIFVEYAGEEKLTRVIAKYKAFGMTEWKPIDLKKVGEGWGSVVPCTDVPLGDFKYYLQGFNAENDPVANSGNRNEPFVSKVINELPEGEEIAHLPGQEVPKQCQEASDCPPNFPGCHKEGAKTVETPEELRPEGESCEDDGQCKSGKCRDDKCTAPEEKSKFRRIWVGISGEIDFPIVGSVDKVCSLDPGGRQQNPGYTCVDSSTGDPRLYPLTQAQSTALDPTTGNKIKDGGFLFGNIRALLSLDYAVNPNILAGVRIGYAFRTFSAKDEPNDGIPNATSYAGGFFAPVHLEARGTYLIGKEPLSNIGVAPLAFVGLGLSQFDGRLGATVSEAGVVKHVDVWRVASPFFFSLGVGARYAVSNHVGLLGAFKFTGAVGSGGLLPVLAPELGVHFGF